MTGRTALVIAAVGTALAVPGNAAAVDHVTLFVSPTKLSRADPLRRGRRCLAAPATVGPAASGGGDAARAGMRIVAPTECPVSTAPGASAAASL